jgi:hypothetical protein
MQDTTYETPMAIEVGSFSELTQLRRIAEWLDNVTGASAFFGDSEIE